MIPGEQSVLVHKDEAGRLHLVGPWPELTVVPRAMLEQEKVAGRMRSFADGHVWWQFANACARYSQDADGMRALGVAGRNDIALRLEWAQHPPANG